MLSPHAVGVTMIVIALIGLTLATWRQQRAVKLLRSRCPDLLTPIGGHVMAGMIAFLGILALLADLIVNLLNRIALTVPRNFPDGLPVPLVRNLRLHATSTRVASFASKQVAPLITR